MILSSLESKIDYEHFVEMLGQFVSSYYKIYQDSLRENELKVMEGVDTHLNIRAALNAQLVTALNCGGVLVLKFDEMGEFYP